MENTLNKDSKPVWMKVKDLTTDHKLQLEDGSWQKIVSIENGMYFNSKLIHFKNGEWSNLLKEDKVQAILISH